MGEFEGKLRYIASPRLNLIPATSFLIEQDMLGPDCLSNALGVAVPSDWPPDLYDHQAMQYAGRQLSDPSEQGWSFWYLTDSKAPAEVLIGICGFKGRPGPDGTVEIGYSVLAPFRNQGYASEAVTRLVEWAFGHGSVREVCAETLPYLKSSIRVLEKNGFVFTGSGSERGVVRYAVKKPKMY